MAFPEGTRKFCITLLPDEENLKRIRGLAGHLKQKFPTLFSTSEQPGTIPHHVTAIGGILLGHSTYEKHIKDAMAKLKVFSDASLTPIVCDVEPLQMNGNNVALRLKFEVGTYILTGNREENQQLVKNLGSVFNLDSIRHITVGHVTGGFEEMDLVYPEFSEILRPQKASLCSMTFTPCVWMKADDGRGWSLWNRNHGEL